MVQSVESKKASLLQLEANASTKEKAYDALSNNLKVADERVTQLEEELRTSQLALTADSDAAKEALMKGYEAKLAEANGKQAKAIEIVKKIKAAATSKLQSMEKERSAERDQHQKEKLNLENKMKTEHQKMTEEVTGKYANMTTDYENKIGVIEKNHKDAISSLQKDREEHISKVVEDQNGKLASLQTQHEGRVKELQSASEQIKKEAESKLESRDKEFETQLAKKTGSIAGLKENYSSQLVSLKDEHDKKLQEMVQSVESKKASLLQLEANASTKEKAYDALSNNLKVADERVTQLEEELRTSQLALTADSDAAKEALMKGYEAKLAEANGKQAKAIEIVKKIKAAATSKLQSMEKERSAERDQHQKEKLNLENKMKTEHQKMTEEVTGKYANMTTDYENKIGVIEKNHKDAISSLQKDREEHISKVVEDQNGKLASLQTQHEGRVKELQSASEQIKKEAESKLESRDKEFETQLAKKTESISLKFVKEMDEERSRNEARFIGLKKEKSEIVEKLNAEKENIVATSKQHLDQCTQEQKAQHIAQMNGLQEKFAIHSDKLKKHFTDKLQVMEKTNEDGKESLQKELNAKEIQSENSLLQVKDLNNQRVAIQRQSEALQTKFSSQNAVKQALQKKLDELQKDFNLLQSEKHTVAKSSSQEMDSMKKEKIALGERLKVSVQQRDLNKNKIEELSGKLEALNVNLSLILDEKKELESGLQRVSKQAAKLITTESELNSVLDQVNKLKLEQTKSSSLLEKLQAEKETSQRDHGQRTVIVGMLEEQLADLNENNADTNAKLEASKYDLSARDEEIIQLKEQLSNMENSLATSQATSQRARKQASESLLSAQKGMDAKKAKTVENLQREVQTLQQQMMKKSSAAQKLIQQREAECIELRKTNKTLLQEIDRGSLSDRKIFELAAQQSNRESVAASEIQVRDKVVNKLTDKLVDQDGNLATAEHSVKEYENRVEELCRVRRRDDVNLDYLKSIVVQYLSKPPGSSEREALLPVLATLLQFDNNDYNTIEEGKHRVSWWGSVAPTIISSHRTMKPKQEQSPLLSAEVSVSSSNAATNGRTRSSLEF